MSYEEAGKIKQDFEKRPGKTLIILAILILLIIAYSWLTGYFSEKGGQAATPTTTTTKESSSNQTASGNDITQSTTYGSDSPIYNIGNAYISPKADNSAKETINKPDLLITSLNATYFPPSTIEYTYTIINAGEADANLDGPSEKNVDNVQVQALVSADNDFDITQDLPAGGSILGLSPVRYGNLRPGNSFGPRSIKAGVKNFDIMKTPYLVLKIDYRNVVDESNETNNCRTVNIERSDGHF